MASHRGYRPARGGPEAEIPRVKKKPDITVSDWIETRPYGVWQELNITVFSGSDLVCLSRQRARVREWVQADRIMLINS